MSASAPPDSDLQGCILGIGNPLLDISAVVPLEFFDKYGVKLNDAILASAQHLPIYADLIDHYSVQYTAGGATQNSIRIAQWLLPAHSTAYMGCIGADEYGQILRRSAEADGVAVYYQVHPTQPTGRCAVCIHDAERSLITDLGAANHFTLGHLTSPSITPIIQQARYIYSAGYFLTVSPPSLMHLAQHCATTGKVLAGNISAPFIAQFFTQPLLAALPYYDYLFGNESEALALGNALSLSDLSIPSIALHLAHYTKISDKRARHVIITQGAQQTIVAIQGAKDVQSFDVPHLDKQLIVDLNGAGDAFVGGFLSQLVQGKELSQCIHAGHYAARTIIQVSGIELKGKPDLTFGQAKI